ncbi:hypothetical protein F4778DRAFT_784346 [Xylariomycetidae sp. FL2044]|nr:hypothetical protein F4778DRAFT_784346 [Xylariomycetidae sp. FL2044]
MEENEDDYFGYWLPSNHQNYGNEIMPRISAPMSSHRIPSSPSMSLSQQSPPGCSYSHLTANPNMQDSYDHSTQHPSLAVSPALPMHYESPHEHQQTSLPMNMQGPHTNWHDNSSFAATNTPANMERVSYSQRNIPRQQAMCSAEGLQCVWRTMKQRGPRPGNSSKMWNCFIGILHRDYPEVEKVLDDILRLPPKGTPNTSTADYITDKANSKALMEHYNQSSIARTLGHVSEATGTATTAGTSTLQNTAPAGTQVPLPALVEDNEH